MKMEFEEGFEKLTGFAPLGWQTRLYSRFVADDPKGFPRRLDIPTGLGKTSILPIWLLARVDNPKLPRRLIYVVNRRTIVDQATRIADELKEKWKGKTLHVSTLRGEREDNGDWKRDPTAQAIVIGTVDLIGSRLLFNAYRGSRWHKSFEAGLVGQDSLIVHDEAHLTGPFDALLDRVVELQNLHTRELIARPMRVLSLSATTIPAKTEEDVFKLIDEDRQEALVKKRLESHKRMTIEELAGKKKLPERIAELAGEYKDSAVRVLVFVQSPADASAVATAIKKLIGKGGEKDRVEILTGTIRGYERDELVGKPVFKHFIERQQLTSGAVYLVCTSAGEIGVDFNADHATCDLSTLDSMIQRLGRVNRRGEQSDTRVRVVVEFKSKAGKLDPQRKVTRTLLESLHHDEQGYDVSPLSLRSLIEKPQYPKALTPEPQKIKLQSMTLDAWALTSIMEDWPIAAEVEQYLHGIVEENGRTEVAWRSELDWIADYSIDEDSLNRLFDQYPLKPRELLSDRTDRVAELLMKIRQTVPDPRILIVGKEASFIDWSKVRDESSIYHRIINRTVVIPASYGGLKDGMISLDAVETLAVDVGNRANATLSTDNRFRIFLELINDEWQVQPHFPESIIIPDIYAETWKRWLKEFVDRLEYRCDHQIELFDDDGTVKKVILFFNGLSKKTRSEHIQTLLIKHNCEVRDAVEVFCKALSLESTILKSAVLAGKSHDLGKGCPLWQHSIYNTDHTIAYAKSGRRGMNWQSLEGYRHEFGSLCDVVNSSEFKNLDDGARDLCLHLIASHHGRARPLFPKGDIDPNSKSKRIDALSAANIARRFTRLQRRYGHWGLAWLEALIVTADRKASSEGEVNP